MSSEGFKDSEEMLLCTHKALLSLSLELRSDCSVRRFLPSASVGGKRIGLNEA